VPIIVFAAELDRRQYSHGGSVMNIMEEVS